MTIKRGFSLLEMSIIIVIIGLIAAAAITLLDARLGSSQFNATKDKLKAIEVAMGRYYAANDRLPCPAPLTVTLGSDRYGIPIYSTGSGTDTGCDTSVTANGSARSQNHNGTGGELGTKSIKSTTVPGEWLRQGAVPTRALGLPDDAMNDSYGNKFTYVVTEKFTTGPIDGLVKVMDGFTTTPMASAAYAVISHGKDHKGAYAISGNVGINCNAQLGKDRENCNEDEFFVDTQFNDLNRNNANWFDDLVIWQDKNAVMGLAPFSNGALLVKFTTNKYDGKLTSYAGGPNALCESEYPGYVFCKVSDLDPRGIKGELPSTANYLSNSGWVNGGSRNCSSWASPSSAESGSMLIAGSGTWLYGTSDCGTSQSLACCRF